MAGSKNTSIVALEADTDTESFLLAGKMMQLLVCPLTKQSLKFDKERQELVSASARLAYPVRGGIPILLPSEARRLDDDEMKKKR